MTNDREKFELNTAKEILLLTKLWAIKARREVESGKDGEDANSQRGNTPEPEGG